MVAEQILQLFLVHLLLVGNLLQHSLGVLRSPQINELRGIDSAAMVLRSLFGSMVAACDRALLGTSDTLRNNQVETKLTGLDLFLVVVVNTGCR